MVKKKLRMNYMRQSYNIFKKIEEQFKNMYL